MEHAAGSAQGPRSAAPHTTLSGQVVAVHSARETPPASSRRLTMPETPAARARVRPPRASSPAAGSYDDTRSGHRSGYEVWRVVGHRRTRERSFEELRLAMRYIHGQQGGRFDIRLPDGVWFSEQRTRRVARVG